MVATTAKPGGMAVILSPWLIHTGSLPVSARPSSSGEACLHMNIGAAEFAVMAAFDLAAQLGAHGHLAIADAQHRHAHLEHRLRRARGVRLR